MFNVIPALDALITMMGQLTPTVTVYRGVPASMSNQVSAYVAGAGQSIIPKADRVYDKDARFFVAFGYRVENQVATAENTVLQLVDSFATLFITSRSGSTGIFHPSTGVTSGQLDLAVVDSPEYIPMAGMEYRIFPIMVTITNRLVG